MRAARTAWYILHALAWPLFCFLLVAVASGLRATPNFPAHAGEKDFSLRVSFFLLAVIPGFSAIGLSLAWRTFSRKHLAVAAPAGAFAGSVLLGLIAKCFSPFIENVSSRTAANAAAVGYMALWLLLACAGAHLAVSSWARRAHRRP